MRVALIAFLFALTSQLVAGDSWSSLYVKGVAAADKKEWATTADTMQRAIALNAKEDANARLGSQRNLPYVPYYYLGISRIALGDAARGIEALKTSESQGAVQKTIYYADLRQSLTRAESSRSGVSKESSEAKAAADQAFTKAMSRQLEATASGASRQETFRRAAQKLTDAFDAKKSGSVSGYQLAAQLANEASDLFSTATAEAKKRRGTGALIAQEPPPVKSEPLPTTLTKTTPPPPPPPVMITNVPTTTTTSAPVTATSVATNPEAAKTTSASRAAQLASTLPLTQTNPSAATRYEVIAAFRSFRGGRFEDAEAALTRLLQHEPRSADAFMLRACTRYTRSLLADDRGLADRAASDFRSALAIRPSSTLDPIVFSPKLIAFFESVKGSK